MTTGITTSATTRAEVAAASSPSTGRAALVFVFLTAVLTWPQVIHPGSVPDNVDSYFSLWRLAWIAHVLPLDPRHLFDANIFYPARHTLAFSDAVLFQAGMSAPFLWLGVPVVFVYNALVLGSFVLCGVGTFLLVRDLTGRGDAALVAGIIFAFAPLRFDHYFHLELLWAQWIPFALWALHRTIQSGRVWWGLATGVFAAALGLSCIYYVVFFATILVVFVPVMVLTAPRERRWRVVRALALGGLVAAAIVAPYALPYQAARADLGEREAGLAVLYGAGPKHYLATMPGSVVYGSLTGGLGTHEKRLFPGAIAIVLAMVGLLPARLKPRPTDATAATLQPRATDAGHAAMPKAGIPVGRRFSLAGIPVGRGFSLASIPVGRGFSLAGIQVAYLLMLVVALDISFGHRGPLFNWLREHVVFYRGLRVPARVGVFVLLVVAVLAGLGLFRLASWLERKRPRYRGPVIACLAGLMVAEYLMMPLSLVPVQMGPGDAYRWMRDQPVGVVAELPMPSAAGPQLRDAEFEYFSTFHWRPLLNGYSGNTPASYDLLLKDVRDFPSEEAMTALRTAGAQYLLVHERLYGREKFAAVTRTLDERRDLKGYGPFGEGGFAVRAYRVLPAR